MCDYQCTSVSFIKLSNQIEESIARKFLSFTSCLSKSLKVIGTGTEWSATYDLVWVCSVVNYGPISYHFQDKGQYTGM